MENKFYQWWKNHRKVVTFGSFLFILGLYIFPVIKEAKYKNTCIELSVKGALNKFKFDKIGETLLEETNLSVTELAKIEGYKNCVK